MEWRNVPGYELYEVSDTGLVRNKKSLRILKPRIAWDGAGHVNLSDCGVQKTLVIHRLVAELFVEQPEGCKYVKHRDGDKSNNDSSNLYWSKAKRPIEELVA